MFKFIKFVFYYGFRIFFFRYTPLVIFGNFGLHIEIAFHYMNQNTHDITGTYTTLNMTKNIYTLFVNIRN